jgi:hypothetical protein
VREMGSEGAMAGKDGEAAETWQIDGGGASTTQIFIHGERTSPNDDAAATPSQGEPVKTGEATD